MIKNVEKVLVDGKEVAIATIIGGAKAVCIMSEFRAKGTVKPLYRTLEAPVTIYTSLEFTNEDETVEYMESPELTIRTTLNKIPEANLTATKTIQWYVDTLADKYSVVEITNEL